MRIFGFEITRSKPDQEADNTIWNPHSRGPALLSSLTADELRYQLYKVIQLAENRACYYLRPGDPKRQLHVRIFENLPKGAVLDRAQDRFKRVSAAEYINQQEN